MKPKEKDFCFLEYAQLWLIIEWQRLEREAQEAVEQKEYEIAQAMAKEG